METIVIFVVAFWSVNSTLIISLLERYIHDIHLK